MTTKQIAENIPHDFRKKILFEWLPFATANMKSMEFKLLWEAYFIYVDPNAVKKEDCPVCLGNVLDTWKKLADAIAKVEKEYNLIEQL